MGDILLERLQYGWACTLQWIHCMLPYALELPQSVLPALHSLGDWGRLGDCLGLSVDALGDLFENGMLKDL